MPGPKPIPIYLSDHQEKILLKIVKRHQTPQQLGKRIRLILLMAEGKNNQQAADKMKAYLGLTVLPNCHLPTPSLNIAWEY